MQFAGLLHSLQEVHRLSPKKNLQLAQALNRDFAAFRAAQNQVADQPQH